MNDFSLNWQTFADKTAIGLSSLCAIHCLALPVLITLAPSLSTLGFAEESFHLWMVVFVLPVSVFALTLGCRRHASYALLVPGVIGLAVLVWAALFGHVLFGESGERIATLAGAALIAYAHWRNFRLCREADCTECHD